MGMLAFDIVQWMPMLRLDGLKVAFVHVPKCAGISVNEWLAEQIRFRVLHEPRAIVSLLLRRPALEGISLGHRPADWYIRSGLVSASCLEAAYSFAVVRNPYERLLSLHNFLSRQHQQHSKQDLDSFVRDRLKSRPRAIPWRTATLPLHYPMVSWTVSNLWSGPSAIVRFEQLEIGLSAVQEKLHIDKFAKRENVNPQPSRVVRITKASVEKIHDYYHEDFSTYGYSRTPPANWDVF